MSSSPRRGPPSRASSWLSAVARAGGLASWLLAACLFWPVPAWSADPPVIIVPQVTAYAGHGFDGTVFISSTSPGPFAVTLDPATSPSWLRVEADPGTPLIWHLVGDAPAAGIGTHDFTLTARDPDGQQATVPGRIRVVEHRIGASIVAEGRLVVGEHARFFFLLNDSVRFTYSLAEGALPPGLSLSPDGVLTGTPTGAGEFPVTILATDSAGHTGRWQDRLIVHDAALVARDDAFELLSNQSAVELDLGANDGGSFSYISLLDMPPPELWLVPAPSSNPGAMMLSIQSGYTGEVALRYRLEGRNGGQSNIATLRLRVVDGTANVPSRSFDLMAGAPFRIDLTEGATGGPFTDVELNLPESSVGTGELSRETRDGVSRFVLTFTPRLSFSGTTRITFRLRSLFSSSNRATLTLRVSRPDPTADADVRGLVVAQVDATRRFARAQQDNFGQRLEQLHDGRVRDHHGIRLQANSTRPACAQTRDDPADCRHAMQDNDDRDADDRGDTARGFGLWSAGTLRAGGGGSGQRAGLDVRSDGLSVGADMPFGTRWALGAGLGWGRDRTEVGPHDSRSQARAYTAAVYASFHPGEHWFADALLGYQQLSFDLYRHSSLDGQRYAASRDGDQWFASLSTGTTFERAGLQWTSYLRLDFARADLDAYREAGALGLAFAAMDVDTRNLRLGLRVQRDFSLMGGRLVPQARLEYARGLDGDTEAELAYVDVAAIRYRLVLPERERGSVLVGVGAWWYAPRGGWSIGLEGRHANHDSLSGERMLMIGVQKQD